MRGDDGSRGSGQHVDVISVLGLESCGDLRNDLGNTDLNDPETDLLRALRHLIAHHPEQLGPCTLVSERLPERRDRAVRCHAQDGLQAQESTEERFATPDPSRRNQAFKGADGEDDITSVSLIMMT